MLSIFSCDYWPSVYLHWRNVYLGLLCIFFSGLFLLMLLNVISCKFWRLISYQSQIFANIFSQFVGCLFICIFVSFVRKLLSLSRPHYLFFISIILGGRSKRCCCDFCQRVFCLCFPLGVL